MPVQWKIAAHSSATPLDYVAIMETYKIVFLALLFSERNHTDSHVYIPSN